MRRLILGLTFACWFITLPHVPAQSRVNDLPPKRAPQPSADKRSVVLTTDIGAEMDDQWTLAHLAIAPEIDLRGVVTTHAPSLAAPAARFAAQVSAEVLHRIPPRKNVPVFAGSSLPLQSRWQPFANPGVKFLIREARRHNMQRRLAVLVTGAATDVASALLLDSSLADRIEIIAMGFDSYPAGGDSWNVKNDVAAWQVLLASRAPITIGDASVTKRDLAMTRSTARELFAGAGGRQGDYLVGLLGGWLDRDPKFCREVTGAADTWIIWDQVVIAHLLRLTASESRPRPTLGDDLRFNFNPTSAGATNARSCVEWVTAIDAKKLWAHFAQHLAPIHRVDW